VVGLALIFTFAGGGYALYRLWIHPTQVPPAANGLRLSRAKRNALFFELVAYYQSSESGKTPTEKIHALEARARERYEAALAAQKTPGLNASEEQDLRAMVDGALFPTPAMEGIRVVTTGWTKVSFPGEDVPASLGCIREELIGEEPLSPMARKMVAQMRLRFGYSPHVDSLNYNTGEFDPGVGEGPIKPIIPVDTLVLIQPIAIEGKGCKKVGGTDTFWQPGTPLWGTEAATEHRLRLVAFAFPLSEEAYRILNERGLSGYPLRGEGQ
jgi:hypothetical protein